MLKTLDIQPIHANTPQAKGRVKGPTRPSGPLVKELRLRGIDDIESANAFLPEFIADYQRFSVAPKTPQNAHRLLDSAALNLILPSIPPESSAAISPAVTAAASTDEGRGYRLRGSTVVCESFDGPISLLCRQDPRLPSHRSRPAAHPHRRRKKPLYRRQGPLPPAQTPSFPRPPLEPLGSCPFHPYPIATPASSRSSRLCQNPIRRGNGQIVIPAKAGIPGWSGETPRRDPSRGAFAGMTDWPFVPRSCFDQPC